MTHPPYDLEAVRQAFPICQKLTYLNHASISPIPLPTRQRMDEINEWLVNDPQALFMGLPQLGDLFSLFMVEIARHINAADPREVVGVPSTSAGLNTVAPSIDWQPGDVILLADQEFPSNVYPWMALHRLGVEIQMIPAEHGGLTLDALARHMTPRTRLVAVSAVQFLSGHRADLSALGTYCRERGVLFAVDAIQAAGHMPIDVQAMNIDILSAGGQKSLMGPPGQGFLYVRGDLAERMTPSLLGPVSVADWEHWLVYKTTPGEAAQRFMMGTVNIPGMVGLVESVRYLRRIGMEKIDAWTCHLTEVALDDLQGRGYTAITPSDPAQHGPITTIRLGEPDQPKEADLFAAQMMAKLNAAGVRVTKHWDAAGMPHLRISTHCYNTEEEVCRVGEILGDYRP